VAVADYLGNVINVERPLGDQNYIGAARHAAVNRDPTGVAPHDLNHHHAVVRLGRGMHAINGFGCNADRSVKTEAEISSAQVVVNGLRHADDLYSALVQA